MAKTVKEESLNPCFCGIYSQSGNKIRHATPKEKSLNPCFCGIYSQSFLWKNLPYYLLTVLILVFVEFTLRDESKVIISLCNRHVLILVFVEFTLRGN